MKAEELYKIEFGEADSIPKESVIRLLRLAKALQIERNKASRIEGLGEMPKGYKIYKCTDCGSVNIKKDNGEIRVGFCDECEHPLWNECKQEHVVKNNSVLPHVRGSVCGFCKGENWINEGILTKPCPACGGKQKDS